jgi:hypothetical protein
MRRERKFVSVRTVFLRCFLLREQSSFVREPRLRYCLYTKNARAVSKKRVLTEACLAEIKKAESDPSINGRDNEPRGIRRPGRWNAPPFPRLRFRISAIVLHRQSVRFPSASRLCGIPNAPRVFGPRFSGMVVFTGRPSLPALSASQPTGCAFLSARRRTSLLFRTMSLLHSDFLLFRWTRPSGCPDHRIEALPKINAA